MNSNLNRFHETPNLELQQEKNQLTIHRRLAHNPEYQRILSITSNTHTQITGCISVFTVTAQKTDENRYRVHRLLIIFRFRIKRTCNTIRITTNNFTIQYRNGFLQTQFKN